MSCNLREIKIKYHLKNAILRQEIQNLIEENKNLKNINKC